AYDVNGGALDSQSIKIDVPFGGNGSFRLTLNVTNQNGCSSTCVKDVEIQPAPAQCIGGLSAVCAGTQGVTYTVAQGQQNNAVNYSWSILPVTDATFAAGHPQNSPTTLVNAGTQNYTLQVVITYQNGRTLTCTFQTIVGALPACSITGSSPVCPSSAGNSYNGPANMDSYAWSITGNGSITPGSTNASVSVTAGPACNQPFTLTLTVTKNGCSRTCNQSFMVNDTTKPSITCPQAVSVQCSSGVPAAATTLAGFLALGGTASDNCDQDLTLSHLDGPLTG